VTSHNALTHRDLTFRCGGCRKVGEWHGDLPANTPVAVYPPPDGWAFVSRHLRARLTGIVVGIQIPVCSEGCAEVVAKHKGENVPEVAEALLIIGRGQATIPLTAVPSLPPRT